jgi:hypothetical protein
LTAAAFFLASRLRAAVARRPRSDVLSPVERQCVIDNGTYKPDGTVNMETTHRFGWDRVWAERESPTPQPVER